MPLPIIGITGARGSGKDTLALALARYGFHRVAFADKLKRIAMDLYGLTDTQVNGSIDDKETIDPRWGVAPRHILQMLGTEVARSVHPETWTRYLLDVEVPRQEAHVVVGRRGFVVADVRFPNEARAIRDRGGIIVRVTRPSSCLVGNLYGAHASETNVGSIVPDFICENDAGLDKLDRFAAVLMERLSIEGRL